MRVRTAKQRAQRIDLNYFKHTHGLRRVRILLSIALPIAAALWFAGASLAGSRAAYSAGPVSTAHAFTEMKCEACHGPGPTLQTTKAAAFRAHTTDAACLSCHDAPAHAANQTPPPACGDCHRDHRGRVEIAKMDDRFCVQCHGDLKTTHGEPSVVKVVSAFPSGHPEFAAVRDGAPQDPGRVYFNHAVHLKDTIRGPNGPEKLDCASCHTPASAVATSSGKVVTTGLMAPVRYQQQCARCHPIFFDERVAQEAPHDTPEIVRAFVQKALATYIAKNPRDISKPDSAFRRVPLNFPRPQEPVARTPAEWVSRRTAADERLLWTKTCAECHVTRAPVNQSGLPHYEKTNITAQWMPKARFNHAPHQMVQCRSCHAAETSSQTSDVLLPNRALCATCHAAPRAPAAGRAEGRCFECHRYHDWTKTHPVAAPYSVTDFK